MRSGSVSETFSFLLGFRVYFMNSRGDIINIAITILRTKMGEIYKSYEILTSKGAKTFPSCPKTPIKPKAVDCMCWGNDSTERYTSSAY